MSLYDQFVGAFNDVEEYLNGQLYGGDDNGDVSFARKLKAFRSQYPKRMLRTTFESLEKLADVRNKLTHWTMPGARRLAEPTATGVAEICRVRDQLIRQATVMHALNPQPPSVVRPDTQVREALDLMYRNDFSQLPVYEEARTYIGLLTTNAVARWLAAQMQTNEGLAESESVDQVLAFTEDLETVEHVDRTITTTEALRSFSLAAETGRPLSALIITEAGQANQSPLAIVVPADLPAMADA